MAGGNDITLTLERSQIVSFAQDGQALLITLTDGQVNVVQGYFAADGTEQNDLFISSDRRLTEVNLTDGGSGTYFATYTVQDVFGKWSLDDNLNFSGDRTEAAMIAPADDQVGMLAAVHRAAAIADLSWCRGGVEGRGTGVVRPWRKTGGTRLCQC